MVGGNRNYAGGEVWSECQPLFETEGQGTYKFLRSLSCHGVKDYRKVSAQDETW